MNREKKDELDKINNAPFVFSCGALCDAYSVIGNMSNAVQKPNIPCWEIDTILETHLNVLKKMDESLDPSKLNVVSICDSLVFPTLASMTKEVTEKHVYKGCPLLIKEQLLHSTRSSTSKESSHCDNVEAALKSSAKSIRPLIRNFVDIFEKRMSKEKKRNEILSDVGALFDVSKIIKTDSVEEIRENLDRYSKLAKLSGNLDEDILLDDLLTEYGIFVKRVKDIAPNFLHKLKEGRKKEVIEKPKVKITYPTRYDQVDLYRKILNSHDLYKDIPNISHLALTGISRTHCEAVVEGMGSVLTLNKQKRSRLDPATVERETVIRWQGPHPGKGATNLIEESLDRHFGGRDKWHFITTYDRAKYLEGSKVIARINEQASQNDKIPF